MSDATMGRAWHADPALLRQYAAGGLDHAGQAAVETHVERCAACRHNATALVTPATLAPVWDGVLGSVRTPRLAWPSRVLRGIGVPEVDLVILRFSTNMVLALCAATVAAVGFALVGATLRPPLQDVLWLVIAPLIPALLVAGAYDSTDPLRELTESTPYSKLRVALLRTALAMVGAFPLALVMSLVPDIDASVVAWLLPALAIALVLLMLITRLRAVIAVTVVGASWLVAVVGLEAGDQIGTVTEPLGQVLSLLVSVVAALVLARQLGVRRPEAVRA